VGYPAPHAAVLDLGARRLDGLSSRGLKGLAVRSWLDDLLGADGGGRSRGIGARFGLLNRLRPFEDPRRASGEGEEDQETERSDSLRGFRRGVGCADRRASFDRAQRRVKRRPASPPLMLFLSLPRIRSFSAGSRSFLLLHQRFRLSHHPWKQAESERSGDSGC
jgi:hypothetical protein